MDVLDLKEDDPWAVKKLTCKDEVAETFATWLEHEGDLAQEEENAAQKGKSRTTLRHLGQSEGTWR